MQNWTPEMWQSGLIGLCVGVVIGYLLLRLTKGSVKKQIKTEAELEQVKTQLNNQKQQLEQHFAESAELLKNIAQDYQKLYVHLANSSTALLPELAQKELFTPNLLAAETVSTPVNSEDGQPRDYSEGSSGILKAEK
ncbi:hypothetical protein B0186_01385 [Canicola haemoglobinophilus]|uniref:Z-ring associated protein G n=1 Tax=Canicola haemoglobinophilus TaxID=733 RepID=A0A1V4B3U3_9PAST|nr:DUF1043 family protein [Canicola haemoglobinophilus]OOS02040.1 hypothetical protein B0186_01385 [Canicola haemoglobinophilus]STO54066.1 Putative cytochrome d ubiquinol oxidase subunit 3 [Canicola haemoglobinophilus]STO60497.1 Putative cytochrome d ubiquinol oxidase subunit 3 [Canicola haemoglobinophilus]STO68599.1 Putative cytochrome d ubiquinol oxidase subunit 3 [Canicola haemoglobinophilus]